MRSWGEVLVVAIEMEQVLKGIQQIAASRGTGPFYHNAGYVNDLVC